MQRLMYQIELDTQNKFSVSASPLQEQIIKASKEGGLHCSINNNTLAVCFCTLSTRRPVCYDHLVAPSNTRSYVSAYYERIAQCLYHPRSPGRTHTLISPQLKMNSSTSRFTQKYTILWWHGMH